MASFLDSVAGFFGVGPMGYLRAARPRLVRQPFGKALVCGVFALLVLSFGFASAWWFGKPGHLVERVLLTWLGVDYLRTAWRVHPQPENDLGLAGGLVDAPLRWNDDGNTMLALMLLVLAPGRWLVAQVASLVWHRQLPTVDELASRLIRESHTVAVDYALTSHSPEASERSDPDSNFANALRRSRARLPAGLALAATAVHLAWVGIAHGASGACAAAAFIATELVVYLLRLQADSPTLAHPDLSHLWLSRRRPELVTQGRQVVQIQVALASVAMRILLATALALIIARVGPG